MADQDSNTQDTAAADGIAAMMAAWDIKGTSDSSAQQADSAGE
ncbi:hypothetical protein [Nocardia concava]|nr:hypothetical protein [Nocardia concava]